MAAAVYFVNSLPGRYCGGLFGNQLPVSASVYELSSVFRLRLM